MERRDGRCAFICTLEMGTLWGIGTEIRPRPRPGRMVSTPDMPNAESALRPGWIFLADGPASTLGRCWKPLALPRSAGGALATWPAAWPAASPAAMAARTRVNTLTCLNTNPMKLKPNQDPSQPRDASFQNSQEVHTNSIWPRVRRAEKASPRDMNDE